MVMIKFKDVLNGILEARRNPEKNPKISIVQALEPYKNDPDIYISFTEVDKIGINPKSSFNTPNGIYTYPLKEIWKHVENDTIPFGDDRRFCWIIKRNKGNFVNDLSKDYKDSDYKKDIKKIEKMLSGLKEFGENRHKSLETLEEAMEDLLEEVNKATKFKIPSGYFWNLTRLASKRYDFSTRQVRILQDNTSTQSWNNLLRGL